MIILWWSFVVKSFAILFVLLIFLSPEVRVLYPYVLEQNARTALVHSIDGEPSPAELAQEAHDINEVYMMLDNQGLIGLDQVTGEYAVFYPRGTENYYVWATGLWFGAIYDADGDSVSDKVFTQASNPHAWDSDFREGRNDQDPDDPLTRVFDSTDPNDLVEWPNQFSDSLSGDPVVYSDQDLVVTYTTKDQVPGFGFQMPLEVNQRSMAVISPDSIDQVIFFTFEVVNWGDQVLEDSWIGFAGDLDVGLLFDDVSSVIFDRVTLEGDTIALDVVYQWDSDFSEYSFTGDPGFVGISYLFGPGNPDDGSDNDGDGIIDESIDNGIDDDFDGYTDEWDEEDVIGLVNFSQFCDPTPPCQILDPQSDAEGYDLLSCDTPGSQFECLETTDPSNKRFMLSSGPFNWLPGQIRIIALAYVFANAVGPPYNMEFVGDPPRPDPNNQTLAEFVRVTEMAREYFFSLYPPLGIGDDFEGNGLNFPQSFSLSQNYPNPFNPSTTIRYDIPSDSDSVPVRLLVYDLRGRLIRTLVDEDRVPGRSQVHWDGRDNRGKSVSSGVYLYRIEAGDYFYTRKMIVVR
jgi:hypothetical protein